MRLIITVKEIKGKCPVYQVSQKIVLDEGYKLNLEETDAVCMHSLASILPYYNAIAKGVAPEELGLAKEGEKDVYYIQCLDPEGYTGGGTVIFEIRREVKDRHVIYL